MSMLGTLVVAVALTRPLAAQNDPVMPPTLAAGLLARFNESSAKLMELAQAIPAEKYEWRPSAGIRSVRQVLVHVAMGNYYTTEDAGVARPTDLPPDPETAVMNKEAVIRFLERANDHMRSALQRLTDEDLRRSTTMFRQQTTYGNVYVFGIGHVHEHLGQLIAYARTAGVVPPWSGAR
jgi:uncharacterized damage-inducible protein DinB